MWRVKFLQKFSNLKKPSFLLHSTFFYYYCSIDSKSQSEHSGLRPDTSNFIDFYAKFSAGSTKSLAFYSELLHGCLFDCYCYISTSKSDKRYATSEKIFSV